MSLHLRWTVAVGLCLIAALIAVIVLLVLGRSDRSPRTQTCAPAPQQSDQPQAPTGDVAHDSVSQPGDDDDQIAGHAAVRSADSDTTEPIGQDTGSADTTYAGEQPQANDRDAARAVDADRPNENSGTADATTPEAQARATSEDADADAPLAGLTVTAGTTTQALRAGVQPRSEVLHDPRGKRGDPNHNRSDAGHRRHGRLPEPGTARRSRTPT